MLCQNLRSRRSGRVSAAADASFNPAAADIGIGGSSSSSSSSEEDTAPNTVSVSMSGHEKMGSGIGSGGGGAEYETSLGLVPQHRQQHEFISATTTANSFGYNPMHSLNSQFYRASIHMQPSYPYNHHAQHNRNQNHQPHATPTYTVPSYSADGYTASQPAETSSTFYAPSAYQHPPPHHQDPEYDDEPDGESSNEFGKRPAPREPSSGFYGARRDSTASATSARGGRGAGGASTRNLHKRVKRGNDGGDSKDPKFCFSDQIVKMGDVSYQIVYRRPPISYADLITYAITQTESKRLKLQSIYTFLTSTFGYFRYNPQKRGWENSIRHNLSMKSKCRFRKVKEELDNEKGSFWSLNLAEPHYTDSLDNAWDTAEKLEHWQGVLYHRLDSDAVVGPTLLSEDERKQFPHMYAFDERGALRRFQAGLADAAAAVVGPGGGSGGGSRRAPVWFRGGPYVRGRLPVPPPPYHNIIVHLSEGVVGTAKGGGGLGGSSGAVTVPLVVAVPAGTKGGGARGSGAGSSKKAGRTAAAMPVVLEVSRRGSNSQVLGGLAGVAWSTSDDEMEDDDEDDDYEVDEDAHAEDGGEVAGADVKKVGCRVKKGMANRGGAVRGRVGDSAAITRGGAEVGKGSLSLKSARTTKKQIQLPPLVSRKECLQILYDQDDDVYEHSFTFRSNEGIHLNESETEQRQCLRQEQEQMQQQECQLRQEGEQEGYHDFSSCIDGGYRPGSRPENNNWIQFVYDSHLAASQHAYLEYYCGDAGEGHVTPPEAQQHYHRQPSSHHGQNVYQSPHGRRPMHGQRLGRGDMSGESESVASFDLFNEMAEEPGGAETSLLFGSCTEPDKFVAAAAAAPLIHVSGLDIERLIADPSVAPPVGGECGSMGVGGGFQFLV